MVGYVTVEESDLYVSTHYVEDSEERARWEDLDEDDKKVLLLNSFEAIEAIPFPGRKLSPLQESAFPRYPNKDVPKAIKIAQIENALYLSDTSLAEDQSEYDKMWGAGVSSYTIGNLSESFQSSSTLIQSSVASPKAKKMLIPFMSGGYRI